MDWKFKENIPPQGSSGGFWYDITIGGYINLRDVIEDKKQLKEVLHSIELLQNLENVLKARGIVVTL